MAGLDLDFILDLVPDEGLPPLPQVILDNDMRRYRRMAEVANALPWDDHVGRDKLYGRRLKALARLKKRWATQALKVLREKYGSQDEYKIGFRYEQTGEYTTGFFWVYLSSEGKIISR